MTAQDSLDRYSTARYVVREAYEAKWARRIAVFFLQLLILTVILHRFAGLGTPEAINLVGVSVVGMALAVIVALISLTRIWFGGQTGAANVHEDFLDAGGSSRVTYVRRISGTTISTTGDEGCGGHGTINAAIAGGFNDTPITDADFDYYGDGDGYRYGLGVAPYVRLGSSKILDPWSAPDYTVLMDAAYDDGARISSNSPAARLGTWSLNSSTARPHCSKAGGW